MCFVNWVRSTLYRANEHKEIHYKGKTLIYFLYRAAIRSKMKEKTLHIRLYTRADYVISREKLRVTLIILWDRHKIAINYLRWPESAICIGKSTVTCEVLKSNKEKLNLRVYKKVSSFEVSIVSIVYRNRSNKWQYCK